MRQRTKDLKQWIDALPLDDVSAAVSQLRERLALLNEEPLDDTDRVDLLETCHDVADEILVSFDDIRLRTLPLEPEQRGELSQSIAGIFTLISSGYRIVVNNAGGENRATHCSDIVLLATYRAMEYLCLAALYSYKTRADAPPTVWSLVKQLYLYAEQHNLVDVKVRRVKGHSVSPTIDALFKQLLVFSAADPFRWPIESIHELFLYLEPHAVYAAISSTPAADDSFVYLLSMDDDTLPRPAMLAKDSSIPDTARWLDVSTTLKRIEKQIEDAGDASDPSSLPREPRLLAQFFKRMSAPRRRDSERAPVQHRVKVAYGLDAICYFFAQPEHALDQQTVVVQGGIEVRETAPFELGEWETSNESAGGYLLVASTSTNPTVPAVGEALGLIDKDDARALRRRIGVVRWVRKPSPTEINVGVELLKGEPQIAQCVQDPPPAAASLHAAVFFPSLDGQPPGLLIHKNMYAPAATMRMEMPAGSTLLDMDLPLAELPLYVLAAVFPRPDSRPR